MSIPTAILNVIYVLDNNEAFKKNVQDALRIYVTKKEYPIDERFRVWSEYCEKEKCSGWLLDEKTYGALARVQNHFKTEDYFDKYSEYDWTFFLEQVTDRIDNESLIKTFVNTIEEFQELLIKLNFGSFTYDW